MRLARITLGLMAGAAAGAIGAHAWSVHEARGMVDRLFADLARGGVSASHGAVGVGALTGEVRVEDVVLARGGARITVGAVRVAGALALAGAARAADDQIAFDNVTAALGPMRLTLPRVEIAGTRNSREDVTAIFATGAATPLAERLARFSAASITVPEIRTSQETGAIRQETAYRDLRATGIVNGVIAQVAVAGGTISGDGGPQLGALSGTIGPIVMRNVDLAGAARIATEPARPGEAPRTIYESYSADGMQVRYEKGPDVQVGRVTGGAFRGRPLKHSIADTFALVQKGQPDYKGLSQDEQVRLLEAAADLFSAFEFGGVEGRDITFRDATRQDAVTGRIARVALTDFGKGRYGDLAMEGLDVAVQDGRVAVGRFALKGLTVGPALQAAAEAVAKGSGQPADFDWRQMVPTFDEFGFGGIDMDVPNERRRAEKERVQLKLGRFELRPSNWLAGVPTALVLAADNLAVTIPPGTKDDRVKDLVAMGYSAIDLSSRFDLRWEERASELAVNEISTRGAGMGALVLKGTLGNITRDLFTGDATTMQIAALGTTVKAVRLDLQNGGLFERVLELQARAQKKTADQLRKELGSAAALGIPAVLGNSAGAKAVGSAVSRFIAKPGRLTIEARAKDGTGLGVGDFVAAGGNPQALLEKIDLTASAD